MSDRFDTTRWTLVLAAGEGADTGSREALSDLCEAYWRPIYAYLRHHGHDADQAADLTQAFFAELLEKGYLHKARPADGKFRSFLLTALKHVVSHERARTSAQKRGGGVAPVSLDRELAESHYSIHPVEGETPERAFERQWAMTVLDHAMQRLRADFERDGKERTFDALKPYIGGRDPDKPYREIGEQLGMTEGAVKMAVGRLRKHFARALRAVGEPIFGMDSTRISMGRLLNYLFEVTERFGMETRTELILLQRTMVVVEGVARSLNPHMNIWSVARPVVEQYIKTSIGPRAALRDFAKTARVMARFGPRLPGLVEEALIRQTQGLADELESKWARRLGWGIGGLLSGAGITLVLLSIF